MSATPDQRRAAHPATSAWVSASAGSGKTRVLTDRVLRLLLAGTAPERILCLTFTKAAAAEMSNRLAGRLAGWASQPQDALIADLSALLGGPVDLDRIGEARALFARVLDAAGGLKIQTIHAFCQALLGRFPLEAGVAPHFQVLDERTAGEMLDAARAEVLARLQQPEGAALAADVAEITAHLHEQSFAQVMGELIAERGRLAASIRHHGGVEQVIAVLYDHLGADRAGDPAEVLLAACRDEACDRLGLSLVCEALAQGTPKEQEKSAWLAAWLEADAEERVRGLDGYKALFLTQKDEPRQRPLTQKAAAAVPGADAVMAAEAERLQRLLGEVGVLTAARGTAALLRLGNAVIEAYARHKRARALLDYDDLIFLVRDLLAAPGAGWVLYKLDGGLDHLLVDEAQDTNPEQWQVIAALCEEFYAGEGAREGPRTVFAVGDPKQSIYSFQRASPEEFGRMNRVFSARAEGAGLGWAEVPLQLSFRSAPAILEAVDAVFARPEAQDGVVESDQALRHEAHRAGAGGLVELWPPLDPQAVEPPAPWEPPLAGAADRPARRRLAELIAERIRCWTDPNGPPDDEAWLASKGRRLAPGDIMVLVRRRNEFVEELVRALKDREVPVSGVDRMVLTDQLAVMDLVALGRVLLLPEDDLSLATVLKGPLIGLDETQLFDLAYGRKGHLWDALARRAKDDPAYRAAYDTLHDLRGEADFRRPFELFAEVLGPRRGRQRLVARLGPEALDPIEEFLGLALAYERENVPSLEGFLHWLESGAQEVKRDLEQGGGAVRVMTVHGAKGLQAPVVFLPDSRQTPARGPSLFWLPATDAGAPPLLLWPIRKAFDGDVAEEARTAQAAARKAEYHRLLYVAMTRAEDRLYVCGWNTNRAAPAGCWYNLVEVGLTETAEAVEIDLGAGERGTGRRLSCPQSDPVPLPAPAVAAKPRTDLPAWAQTPPAPEAPLPQALAPSRPAEAEPGLNSPLAPTETRFRRGLIIHSLLETLPELPAADRPAAAARFLASPLHGLTAKQQAEIAEEALTVMSRPELSAVFGPGSRAEVPLVGRLASGAQVSGQVDRLVVSAGRILVIDYKTNRPPPTREEDVPILYLKQMAAYKALLSQIYPDRPVDCFLLWTDVPRLMQLSSAQMAAHAP